ncbi:ABC transporter ATP-binding protein [Aestuariivirga sp.]|jgi:ATP-binding cassette subfamily C protein|uniref:ABC transporter ATP-binding protein n=1 Tax=Aestuariivirga sp. TaxID=2650926 RepID=UPI00378434E1
MNMILKIFLQGDRLRSVLVLLSLVVAAAVEAIGVGALLPAAAALYAQDGKASQGSAFVQEIIAWSGMTPSFETLVLLIAAAAILKALISFLALSYAAVVAAELAVDFQDRLINAAIGASWRFYADQHAGNFAAAVANDASRASQAYLFGAQAIAAGLQSVLLAAVALVYSWKLALVSIVIGLAITTAMNRLVKLSRAAGSREANMTGALTVRVVDLIANMKPLKAMHRFEPMLRPISQKLIKLRRALITVEMSKQALNLGNDVVVTLLITITAYFAYTSWKVSLPELLVFTVIFFKINSMFSKVQKAVQQAVKFERFYTRISELTTLALSHQERNPGRLDAAITKLCRFENVSFSHAEAEIIRGIDLEIPAGQITVLRGPSGAGKTTIIDLLIGLYEPDRGSITVDGVSLNDIDLYKWRRKIGYVPQELSLLHAKVRENITFDDPHFTDDMVWSALRQAKAEDFVRNFPQGLDTDVGEMGGKMSGGQRQRISLARALVGSPELLILDEVTSALDPATEQEIVNNIALLRGKYTIVAITHRPAWTTIADRLYEIDDGRVLSVESHLQVSR